MAMPSPSPRKMTTMRAITYDTFGSADVLAVPDIARPVPSENEVLVRVHAAGVERGAWHMMTGKPYLGRLAFGLRTLRRKVLGIEVAGTVDVVGTAVIRFAAGDEVYGFAMGSFAEYAVAREDRLAAKANNLTFEQAAAVPVSGVTALQALTDLVRSLRAGHVLDYAWDDYADGSRHYDLVIDLAGKPSLSRLRRALTVTGTAVITGGEHGGSFSGGMNRQIRPRALSPFLRQRLIMLLAKQRTSDLERLTALIETGQITPCVEKIYPLREAGDAVRRLEAGRVRGKAAISI
jgi:NADPH:quinone reductase-like Zn-dependent oxidoreductase